MEFIETSIFTKQVMKLLPDNGYQKLQSILMLNPGVGAISEKSAGIDPAKAKEDLYGLFIISINQKRFTCYLCTRKTNKRI